MVVSLDREAARDVSYPDDRSQDPDTDLGENGSACDEVVVQALLWALRGIAGSSKQRLLLGARGKLFGNACS